MNVHEIPLTADNQRCSIDIAGRTYQIGIIWRESGWIMDLLNERSVPIMTGIPLVTGVDLLGQYAYLGLGFKLIVVCDDPEQIYPTQYDLGAGSHLLVVVG